MKCIVLIDGSNFYFKLKDLNLHRELEFDFYAFAKKLADKHQIVDCVYYVGAVRTDGTKHTQKLFNRQQKLFAHLKKHHFKYSLGYLLKSGGKLHEKGVDVNIAVDILVSTYEDLCDHIILVSSDTDLLPAIKTARDEGKKIIYVGFENFISRALSKNCSSYIILKKNQILEFNKNK